MDLNIINNSKAYYCGKYIVGSGETIYKTITAPTSRSPLWIYKTTINFDHISVPYGGDKKLEKTLKPLGKVNLYTSSDEDSVQIYKLIGTNNFGVFGTREVSPIFYNKYKNSTVDMGLLSIKNAKQVMDYIIQRLHFFSDASKDNHDIYSFYFNLTECLPLIMPLLTVDQRLEALFSINEVIYDTKHCPFYIPSKGKRQQLRRYFYDHRAAALLQILGVYIGNEIILSNTEKEIHALRDYFYERAYLLDICYGSIDGFESKSKTTSASTYDRITYKLKNRREKEYRFFDAPKDTWTPNSETRRGTAVNLSAFMARRAIRKSLADKKDYEIVNEYNKFCSAIHRTTNIFSDICSVRYNENGEILIPQNAEPCSLKEAKQKILELAEQTNWPAMKYVCYTQLAIISKARKAAYYSKKRKSIIANEVPPFEAQDLEPTARWKGIIREWPFIILTFIICTTVLRYVIGLFIFNQDFIESYQQAAYGFFIKAGAIALISIFFLALGRGEYQYIDLPYYYRRHRW